MIFPNIRRAVTPGAAAKIHIMNNNTLPQRKHPRLNNFDYSKNGYYFVTICAKQRKHIFSHITVKKEDGVPYIKREDINIVTSNIGMIAEKYILSMKSVYKNIEVDSYVIMPDHIHLLIKISGENDIEQRKTLDTAISAYKALCSKDAGFSLWQTSFYEHIIRNANDLYETRKYIRDNPLKWYHENKY